MIHKPFVTAIIPFFNEETFLEETVQSVLDQDYDHWELLLVDDGSTNRSTEIAKKFASKYPAKIFYIEHDNHLNKGVSATRNLGIWKAKGTLIAFLDADDKWLPNKLSHQVSIFEKFPDIGMIAEASIYWYNWNDLNKKNILTPVGAENDKVYDPPQMLFEIYPLKAGAAPCPCSLMIKKTTLEKIDGFEEQFVKEYQIYEDQAFLTKVYLYDKVYVSSAANNLYRQRPDSCVYTGHSKGMYHAIRKYFLHWFKKYLEKNAIDDKKIHKLLNKSLYRYDHPNLYFLFHSMPQTTTRYIKRKLARLLKGKN